MLEDRRLIVLILSILVIQYFSIEYTWMLTCVLRLQNHEMNLQCTLSHYRYYHQAPIGILPWIIFTLVYF